MQYLIKTKSEKHDIEMAITINIDKNPRNVIDLFLSNLKIEIIAIKKDDIYITQDLKTIFELIQEYNIKTLIIDNLDLW